MIKGWDEGVAQVGIIYWFAHKAVLFIRQSLFPDDWLTSDVAQCNVAITIPHAKSPGY